MVTKSSKKSTKEKDESSEKPVDLFTREHALQWLTSHNIKDADALRTTFLSEIEKLANLCMEEELKENLGYEKYDRSGKTELPEQTDSRNGHSKKTVKSSMGELNIRIPRDAQGTFSPTLIPKYCRKFPHDIEGIVLCLYAKGLSTRDISDYIQQIYGETLSSETISRITDQVTSFAKEWQIRPLTDFYPILYLDGIVFHVRQDHIIVQKTVYLVFGIDNTGYKEILGIWIGESESAKFWMSVLSDLKNRGVKEILIACVDGLAGFEQAIHAIYPDTTVQLCIVHQIRNSLKCVSYKEKREFCEDMRAIYSAPNLQAGTDALDVFTEKWSAKYSTATNSWNEKWVYLSAIFDYPKEIRRLIYTTNPIESFNAKVRSMTNKRKAFPTSDSLLKCLYLVVKEMETKWDGRPIPNWGQIRMQLKVYYGKRVEQYL